MSSSRTVSLFRVAGAAFVLAGGAVHLQQYDEGLRYVPKIGTSFLLNAAASVVVALWIVVRRDRWSSLAGIAMALGTLLALGAARYGALFDYREPTWRTPVVVAVAVEVLAVVVLTGAFVLERRPARRSRSMPEVTAPTTA
jgi:hypothetical protein